MVWPAGRVKPSVQPLIGEVPVLVTAMEAVRPESQELTVYATRGAVPEAGGTEGVALAVAEADGLGVVVPLVLSTKVIALLAGMVTVNEPFAIRIALCG